MDNYQIYQYHILPFYCVICLIPFGKYVAQHIFIIRMYISAMYGALWDMGEVHCGNCKFGLWYHRSWCLLFKWQPRTYNRPRLSNWSNNGRPSTTHGIIRPPTSHSRCYPQSWDVLLTSSMYVNAFEIVWLRRRNYFKGRRYFTIKCRGTLRFDLIRPCVTLVLTLGKLKLPW